MKIVRHLLLYAIYAIASSCGPPPGQGLGDDDSNIITPRPIPNTPVPIASQLTCPKGTSLTYQTFGKAFVRKYCTSCHSPERIADQRFQAPENVNLDNYEDIVVWRTRIFVRAIEAADMPPVALVPDYEKQLLQEWLGCGVPRNF